MSIVMTRAVTLRRTPYGESSEVLRFLTAEYGQVGVMARGVRARRGKGGSSPAPFSSGTLGFTFRSGRELQTLSDWTPLELRFGLAVSPVRVAGASFLCEMVLRHSGEEPNPGLLRALEGGLDRLASPVDADDPGVGAVATVVSEGWSVLAALGYGPELERCVVCGEDLDRAGAGDDDPSGALGRFDALLGGLLCSGCGEGRGGPRVGPLGRQELRTLVGGREILEPPPLEHLRAHLRLLRDFVLVHVTEGSPLRSYGVLAELLGEP